MGSHVTRDAQERANDRMWSRTDLVRQYANRQLRPAEVAVLVRYRDDLAGRVLELGCGAGRVTGYLAEIAAEVYAMDVSPAMVAACVRAYPAVKAEQGDLRDLSRYGDGSFDAIVAPYGVVDVLNDARRRHLLDELRRIVTPRGLVVFSSHNRNGPAPRLDLGDGGLLRRAIRARHLPAWLRNRRRMLPLERREPAYAILNDVSHDWAGLHYYVTRDAQEEQLAEHGLSLVACLDADGRVVPPGGLASSSTELYYLTRPGPKSGQ
jgi:SAM-dependent methyltransferase